MLRLTEFHGIGASLQCYRLDEVGIEKAMADLREGKMRFRGVLCASERRQQIAQHIPLPLVIDRLCFASFMIAY